MAGSFAYVTPAAQHRVHRRPAGTAPSTWCPPPSRRRWGSSHAPSADAPANEALGRTLSPDLGPRRVLAALASSAPDNLEAPGHGEGHPPYGRDGRVTA